ncbi:hypothetical protein Pfo_031446 [Paulownia fortunei]|nr:hypothetical protein Pfo_031446 [Paulownia fortunei]
MASLRGFFLVMALLVINFTFNSEARHLGEIRTNSLDSSHLGEEKLPYNVICSLLGGCERSADTSNIVIHPSNEELQGKTYLSMDDSSHLGEEKLPYNVICSLLGGCEQSADASNFVIHPNNEHLQGKTYSNQDDPSHLGEKKDWSRNYLCSYWLLSLQLTSATLNIK